MIVASARTVACLMGLVAYTALAAPRSLDPTFGTFGLAASPFEASAFTLDNGRIVLGGAIGGSAVVARLDRNGAPDPAFGDAGVATLVIRDTAASVMSVAHAAAGTYAAGIAMLYGITPYVFVARLDDAGRQDPAFGGTGAVMVAIPGPQAPGAQLLLSYLAVAAAADGRPVVLAHFGSDLREAMLIRFGVDGSVDPTFGNEFAQLSGDITLPGFGPLIDDDGAVYVGASGNNAPVAFVAKVDSRGRLDPSFGDRGRAALPVRPGSGALASDGRLLVAAHQGGTPSMQVLRLLRNGAIDPAFGTGGTAQIALGECPLPVSARIDPCPRYEPPGLAVLPDGSILQTGLRIHSADSRSGVVMARFDSNGVPDATFPFAVLPAWSYLDGQALVVDAARGHVYVWREIYDGSVARLILAPTATTVSLEGPRNAAGVGEAATFRVTVEGANVGGEIALAENARTIPGCARLALNITGATSASATCNAQLAAGVHQVVAAFYGNTGNSPSISAPWVTVVGEPVNTRVTEFQSASTGDYFLTTDAVEAATLGGTWKATGLSFHVFPADVIGTATQCRYFAAFAFAPASAHFFGLSNQECSLVYPWYLEGRMLPVMRADETGTCPGGTTPLYRLYNQMQGGVPLHRLTVDPVVRSQMLAVGWIAEGLGIGVHACALP